jgi:hypothetical protein
MPAFYLVTLAGDGPSSVQAPSFQLEGDAEESAEAAIEETGCIAAFVVQDYEGANPVELRRFGGVSRFTVPETAQAYVFVRDFSGGFRLRDDEDGADLARFALVHGRVTDAQLETSDGMNQASFDKIAEAFAASRR